MSLRSSALRLLDPAIERHATKVSRVVAQLRHHAYSPFRASPISFKKKAVSHPVPKRHDRRRLDPKIDISDLDEILEIDVAARTCTAEGGVTFVDLVAAPLRHGLVPLVVPELKTITVGGAVSGCSLESMSFQYSGFHDTCLAYEVITGRGEVLHCTPDNAHRLIFQMMYGSFGTLGVLSKLTFRLVPATACEAGHGPGQRVSRAGPGREASSSSRPSRWQALSGTSSRAATRSRAP